MIYDILLDIFFHPGGNERVWNGINVFELAQRLANNFCVARKGHGRFKIGPICQTDSIKELESINAVPSPGPAHQNTKKNKLLVWVCVGL